MRKKTIRRNPLDQLDAPKRKGGRTVPVIADADPEIRETLLQKAGAPARRAPAARKPAAKRSSGGGWLKALSRWIG